MARKMHSKIWADQKDVRYSSGWWDRSEYENAVPYIRADLAEEMAKVLEESRLQIEYMQSKFEPTGSGNAVLSRIHTSISKWEYVFGQQLTHAPTETQ